MFNIYSKIRIFIAKTSDDGKYYGRFTASSLFSRLFSKIAEIYIIRTVCASCRNYANRIFYWQRILSSERSK